jgi:hypothetical protein
MGGEKKYFQNFGVGNLMESATKSEKDIMKMMNIIFKVLK